MFVMITTAPQDRPLYLRDLLEVIALQYGMAGQFTYRLKWFSSGALNRLNKGNVSGLIVYAEAVNGQVMAYPLRYVRDVRFDVRYPSQLVDAASRIDSVGLTDQESNLLIPVRFIVENLFDYAESGREVVENWSRQTRSHLRVDPTESSTALLGSFLQEIDGIAYPREERVASRDRWLSLTDALHETTLSTHALVHIDGIYPYNKKDAVRWTPSVGQFLALDKM